MSRWRRSKIERLRDRGDSRRLMRLLDKHDWLVDRDGMARDLAVGRRVEAVTALGTIGTDHAEEGVVRALEDDDPRVKLAAVMALRPKPSPLAAETLARTAPAWREPTAKGARGAAVDLLADLGDEILAVVYAQTLANDPDREELTAEDEEDLRRLFRGGGGDEATALGERLVERLAALDDGRRRRAQQVLVALGGPAVLPLIGALNDPARQQSVCVLLGRIRDAQAVPALIGVLRSGGPDSRPAAARALGDIRDGRALEALLEAASDADTAVRDAALDALDKLRSLVAGIGAAALARSYEEAAAEQRRTTAELPLGLTNRPDHRALLRRLLRGGQ